MSRWRHEQRYFLRSGRRALDSCVGGRTLDYDLWLHPGMNHVEALADLLKPYDARRMRSYPVSNRVNQVRNDDAECSKPVELESSAQRQLFV